MAFTRVEFKKLWTKAEDFPAFQDSEEQVRADLQYHPDALRDFINALIQELEAKSAAGTLGATNGAGEKASIQSVLDKHADELAQLTEDVATMAAGGVPAAIRNSVVTFVKDSWAAAGGAFTLKISKSDHKKESESFGYNLYQLADGTYCSGTRSTAETCLTCGSDGSIILTADEAYSGKIVLFGM